MATSPTIDLNANGADVGSEPIGNEVEVIGADIVKSDGVRWDKLAKTTLERLSSLSFRQGSLESYLNDIAQGVSELIAIDWSIVTLSLEGDRSRILASSLNLEESAKAPFSLHGSVAKTVVETGCALAVPNTDDEAYGSSPEGYRAYLGVPLRSPTGKLLGTICSFHEQPRQFNPEEIKCVELFAERATTAIDNYQMYQTQLKFNEVLEAEVAKRTADLRIAQAQLIEQERLAAIGEFTSMIVHEIRNPLTTVDMALNALQASEMSERDRRRLSLALEEEHRLKQLLNEILQYAKPQLLETTTLSVNQLIAQMVSTLSEQPLIADRQLHVRLPESEVLMQGDVDKLKQVLINLISNACEAVEAGETVEISLSRRKLLSTPQICLTVRNGGEPIPENVLAQLTKPFFSTKSSGNGLGLAIVKRIIEAHEGTLTFTSTAEAGTVATVEFPWHKQS